MEGTIETIQRILHKLAQVRDRGLTCFGSDHHHFRLNRPLSEAKVRAFERRHHVRLPEDYRQFLLQAGNGGAGPYCGLLPLEKWNDAVLEDLPDYLARPSPLRPNMPDGVAWEQALNSDLVLAPDIESARGLLLGPSWRAEIERAISPLA